MRDQMIVLLFVALVLILLLLLFRAYLRQPPARHANVRIVDLFDMAIQDKQFWWICIELCKMDPQSVERFRRTLQRAVQRYRNIPSAPDQFRRHENELDLMQLGLLRGGWAGRHPVSDRPVVAIADYPIHPIGYSAAIHELFHLVRDYQQIAPFDLESELAGFKLIRFLVWEEATVWWKTMSVAPVGTGCILFGYGGVILTICTLSAQFVLSAAAR